MDHPIIRIHSGMDVGMVPSTQPKPELAVHFIECGQGSMTVLVLPSKTIVYDCRIIEDDKIRILGYLKRYLPERTIAGESRRWIDWFICSHRDADHIHGLDVLNSEFPIRGIVDPGTTSGSTEGPENQYYMALRRRLKDAYGESAVRVPTPSTSPYFQFDGVKFYCLCSGKDDPPSEDGHYGNNVFQVEYAGNRILLTGDSDWRAWKERIMPDFVGSGLLETTVLMASHHGSRSFFVETGLGVDEDEAWEDGYEDHLDRIHPKMTVISCGAPGQYHHPNETALGKYKAKTAYEQVYLTRELGTLVGQFHSDGRWTVTPSRFLNGWGFAQFPLSGKPVTVRCWTVAGENRGMEVACGDALAIGHKLEFQVTVEGDPIAPATSRYVYEISNGGTGGDSDRDDIYTVTAGGERNANVIRRDLNWLGAHLLRCRVHGPGGYGQAVFVVRGIP